MMLFAILLGAGALAWFTYWRLEGLGRRALVPAAARAVAWAALGLLVADFTCATSLAPPRRPLVLLDASLSMGAAGGRWAAAQDTARALGEVRRFGDPAALPDTLPSEGRSDLEPTLRAAAASDRPVIVVTDGELTDPGDLPPELLERAGVRLFPRDTLPDLGIARVTGPLRATTGDTVRLEVEVRATAGTADTTRLEVRVGSRVLASRPVRAGGAGTVSFTLPLSTAGMSGDVALRVVLAGAGDAEPRDDSRLYLLRVTPTPGVVLLASPPDWDSRFLYQALRDVAELPLRAYLRLETGPWRSMATLQPVTDAEVALAARRADLLVLKGQVPEAARISGARGRWSWPSGEAGGAPVAGEWYAAGHPVSPIAGAFVGLPVDSFPPLVAVAPLTPPSGGWVGLSVQQARRGAERPVIAGGERGGRREVTFAADGLWRWAFRGGSSEQAYRALVAGTLSWLIGGADSSAGVARVSQPVVPNGRPLVFTWAGPGAPAATPITITLSDGSRTDTLRFDGAGRAELRLSPGIYPYQLPGGARGTVAVDTWSEEWLPHRVRLTERPAIPLRLGGVAAARGWVWLFALLLAALAVEWLARRRLGLR